MTWQSVDLKKGIIGELEVAIESLIQAVCSDVKVIQKQVKSMEKMNA